MSCTRVCYRKALLFPLTPTVNKNGRFGQPRAQFSSDAGITPWIYIYIDRNTRILNIMTNVNNVCTTTRLIQSMAYLAVSL